MLKIDYIPVRHDPAREQVQVTGTRCADGTPMMDFVMSWSSGFRAVAMLAAFSLVVMILGGM